MNSNNKSGKRNKMNKCCPSLPLWFLHPFLLIPDLSPPRVHDLPLKHHQRKWPNSVQSPLPGPLFSLTCARWGSTQTSTRQLGNRLLEQTKTVLSFCIQWHLAIISFLPLSFSSCSQFGQCQSVHCPLIQCSALCVYDPHICALSFSEAANITHLIPLQIDLFELYLHDKTLFSH